MKNKKEPNYSLQLLIQLQKLSANEKQHGYAMLMASVMSILIFSMLSVYLFSSRLYKSSANAILDSGSTFYAAEYSLNKRANSIRTKIGNLTRPSGNTPTGTTASEKMASCLGNDDTRKGTDDFACSISESEYKEAIVSGTVSADTRSLSSTSELRNKANVKYKNYSFVQEIIPTGGNQLQPITSGDYRGLNSLDYRYRVYSTALKKANTATTENPATSAQTMLQMEFVDRFIPIFQFAAFYEGDLELNSGTDMTINGPIHTNANLYIAPSQLIRINGNSTYVGSVYRTLQYAATGPDGTHQILLDGGGPYSSAPLTCAGITNGCIDAKYGWSSSGNTSFPVAISDTDITASNGRLKKQTKLQLPDAGFLSKKDSKNKIGLYYDKADLRIDFDPANTGSKLNVTRMNQSGNTGVIVKDFSTVTGLIESLQKPVMLRVTTDADRRFSEIARLCPRLDNKPGEPAVTKTPANYLAAMPVPYAFPASFTLNDKKKVVDALTTAIAKTDLTDAGLAFSQMQLVASNGLKIKFAIELNSITLDNGVVLNTAVTGDGKNILNNAKLYELAASVTSDSNGGCFLPAPMQVLTNQFDKKESTTRLAADPSWTGLKILQSNIKSLTVWNRDGVYWDTSRKSTADMLFTRKAITSLAPVDQLPAVDNGKTATGATCDYDCMGLGAIDTNRSGSSTQGGLVWHFSMINDTASPYNYPKGDRITRVNNKGLSQFGFAFTGGNRLPAALTIASDQAIYLQGDYNNPSKDPGDIKDGTGTTSVLDDTALVTRTSTSNPPAREKKPAAVLADSLIVLSNSCSNGNNITCLTNSLTDASTTVVRAAILSGTEKTNISVTPMEQGSGVNNHLGFREDWYNPAAIIKYRGSLVSKGIPTEFNGKFFAGCINKTSSCYNIAYYVAPNRDIGFDTDFNSIDGLPPLTPNVNLLQQKVYKRDYDSNNR
jgi:hypothetical protein